MTNDSDSNDECEIDLSSEELRLLKEAIKEHDNPVRYAIYSQIIPDNRKWIMFLNISSSTYARELSHATLFKKYEAAKAVAAVYGDDTDHLRIAKVTTKGDKLKVLQYGFTLQPENELAGSAQGYKTPTKNVAPESWDGFLSDNNKPGENFMGDRDISLSDEKLKALKEEGRG